LVLEIYIIFKKQESESFKEGLLRGGVGRIIVLAPIVRRIEIEERFRPVKASDQILVVFVFDNLLKPSVGVKPIYEFFPGVFSEHLQGICSSESP
jgi:hypothetical protein